MMNVLPAEKNIGITTFLTNVDGVGGKLRSIPEDFVVTEISNYPSKKENGRFTIADVTSTNWETNLLLKEISNRLHISRKRVGFAGTKDKRAKTTQLMSFYNVPVEKLSNVKIKDVVIENIYTSDKPVKIGNLVGNKFEITVRNIEGKIKDEQVRNISNVITVNSGFPNFYGIQRFGIIRPITHVVGRCIARDDFEGAVMTYIANPIEGEDEETYILRKNLEETRDFSEALKSYPRFLNFEKAIMNKLVVESNDFLVG
jgi:tRNA pseudouridine13 synthase